MDKPKLKGFRFEQLLGRGGMGEVYRAWEEKLERWVAVKVVRAELLEHTASRRLFRREARTAAQINHAAVVQVHQILESRQRDYIVMELIEGESLGKQLRERRFAFDDVLPVMKQVADGLAAAHAKGIVHRDLKAENIIVAPGGQAKILDFGLAKRLQHDEPASEKGTVFGTCHYMSPEQARGMELDHRSDLFSLGVLLYRALTRQFPFTGESPDQVLFQVCTHRQPSIQSLDTRISPALSDLVDRLLEKDRESRPWSTRGVAETLANLSRRTAAQGPLSGLMPMAGAIASPTEETRRYGVTDIAATEPPPSLSIPAAPLETRRPGASPASIERPAGKPPILYVDDEPHHLTLFEAAFGDDYTVHTAHSAREALDVLGREPVHLVLADQRMPEITGVQLLEALAERYPDVMRILVTGHVDIDAVIRAINAGSVYRYVTKPWDEKELRVAIDRALESFELRRLRRRLMEDLERQADREIELRRTFQPYAPAAVVEELLDSGHRDHFLGEPRVVAVLISDIRDFTNLTRHLDPQQLIHFLNRYFSHVGAIVSRHRGSVQRLRRDALISVFGAPVSSIDVAGDALRAASEMVDSLPELRRLESATLRGEKLHLSIGLHLGEVIAGNIGSDVRMEYTVVGHTMTIAERIHQASKAVPDSILLSQDVHDQARDAITDGAMQVQDAADIQDGDDTLKLYRIVGVR